MCGRFNNHLPKMHGWTDLLHDWTPEFSAVRESYNVTPTSTIGVLKSCEASEFNWQAMRWGMVPSWSKEFDSKYATFNARIESVQEKPTFKNSWRKARRCLVPMAGYFEWLADSQNASKLTSKQPFYISDPNMGLMLAAGLYEPWGDKGEHSVTILTKPAAAPLVALHTRMPLLLTPTTLDKWMAASNDDLDAWWPNAETPELVYWPVSKEVGNVRNDHERLIEPVDV